jgi:proline racemase
MKSIELVSVNCCGEVGDVIVNGVEPPQGSTVFEQAEFIKQDKKLWKYVLNEPRGGVFKHVNLIVPPKDPAADMGFIIMEPADVPPMSGSNSICVATVLLEKGIIPITNTTMNLTLEAPGGLINVEAKCNEQKVESVKITNFASFVLDFEKEIKVEGVGNLIVTTAYGGDSFVLVNSKDLGIEIKPNNADQIVTACSKIIKAANEQLGFSHPLVPNMNAISFCMLMDKSEINSDGIKQARNTVCIRPKKLDRSPCGTGTSARLAYMHLKKEINLNEKFISQSILDTTFECELVSEEEKDGTLCVVPEIKGQAWITGEQKLYLDDNNPFPYGYRLTDTWPKE